MRVSIISWLFIFIVGLTGCATLNQSEINKANRVQPDSLELTPMLDIYGQRIDIVRNKTDRDRSTEGEGSEEVPYHDAGFYLGNGLFYDLNGNLCLLIPKIMGIKNDQPFHITKKDHTTLFNRITALKRDNNSFTARIKKGIGFSVHYNIHQTDSVTELIKGKLSNQKLVLNTNGDYEYERALAGEDIQKTARGYYIKNLLNRDDYIKKDHALVLKNDLTIRHRKNAIEILKLGWGKEQLLYQMIFTENAILIYNNKYTGYKIAFKNQNTLEVYNNQRLIKTYQKK
ncbi:hypothetical protein [Salinivirga cyanobacteriivorans]